MRKITVVSMISLDGVMQGPGAPGEDISGGFEYGGWVAPYDDQVSGKVMEKLMKPSDLLLGRRTFEIWENYWPEHESGWPGISDVRKYVLSTTREKSNWKNSIFINSLSDIENLKNTNGSDIQVWGSSKVVQLLLKHELVDELWLIIHPLILGKGKMLFDNSASPGAFTLIESITTPRGVIIANYRRAGKVETGIVGA